jgi:hypothetical protein
MDALQLLPDLELRLATGRGSHKYARLAVADP